MLIQKTYGALTPQAIGVVMLDTVSRATQAIREQRFSFIAEAKAGYDGEMDDVVTSADKAAQAIYKKSIEDCFPDFGIISEEDHLKVDSKHPTADVYVTIDPLDGTKAFARLRSHGVGTMMSIVYDKQIIAAAIGDVNTQEIYYYRPESTDVWRLVPQGSGFLSHLLKPNAAAPLAKRYVVLPKNPTLLSSFTQKLIAAPKERGLFKDIAVADGSIGTNMARLWKGEVGAYIMSAEFVTPWDFNPVLGISQMLGFEFYEIDVVNEQLKHIHPDPLKEVVKSGKEVLVVHRDYQSELEKCISKAPQ